MDRDTSALLSQLDRVRHEKERVTLALAEAQEDQEGETPPTGLSTASGGGTGSSAAAPTTMAPASVDHDDPVAALALAEHQQQVREERRRAKAAAFVVEEKVRELAELQREWEADELSFQQCQAATGMAKSASGVTGSGMATDTAELPVDSAVSTGIRSTIRQPHSPVQEAVEQLRSVARVAATVHQAASAEVELQEHTNARAEGGRATLSSYGVLELTSDELIEQLRR